MIVRWPRVNQKIWMVVFGLSLYVLLKGSFLYTDIVKNGPVRPLGEPIVGGAQQLRDTMAVGPALTPAITPPPVCTVDYLGVPLAMQGPACVGSANCANITCRDLLFGNNSDKAMEDKDMYDRSRAFMKDQPKVFISESTYVNLTQDCDAFKMSRGYILKPMSTEEEEFPIAYNILMHRDIEQVERLLRSIYRPQNTYCIHVDLNSPEPLQQAIHSIVNCFPNVFLASTLEHIVYAGISRLQADINCMQDHLTHKVQWKYLLNLAGQSFPLKTNLELVQILKTYDGSNDIEGIHGHRVLRGRFVNEWIELDHKKMNKTGRKNPKPPHDIDIVRGSAYGVFSRDFVDYIINDPWAQDLLEWSRHTWSPDEHYWATLHHTYSNPHMKPPGSYRGDPNTKPWLAVFVKWGGVNRCMGMWKRGVCVFGVADLPDLIQRKEMFCNKFYLDFQPLGLDCLEAWIQQKTHCPQTQPLDTAFYKELPFVKKSSRSFGSWFM